MHKEKVLLFFANTKYSVHYHGYITKEGFIHVRKRDTSMPDNYDHVDVLQYDSNKHVVGSRLRTKGKAHVSDKVRGRVHDALNDLLDKARLPYEYTQDNLKKLYKLGVR